MKTEGKIIVKVDLLLTVKEFVAKETSSDVRYINTATTLFGDLGVDGGDGVELIEKFGKEFGVDISSFQPAKHFGPEGMGFPLFSLVYLFLGWWYQDSHKGCGLIPISIGDLVAVATIKKWSEIPQERKRAGSPGQLPTPAPTDPDVRN